MQPLKFRKIWLGLGLSGLLVIGILSLMPFPPTPDLIEFAYSDKLQHGVAYLLIMLWFAQLFPRRAHKYWLFGLLAYSGMIEILQGMGGHRYMELADMLANFCGLLLGWWLGGTACGQWLSQFEGRFLLSRA